MALITTAEVIALTLPAKNLDPALLDGSIPLAETKYIKKALGWKMYEQLIAEYAAAQYTGLNQLLIETYIQPCLARYVVYEAMPMIKSEITSNGLQSLKNEFTVPASDNDTWTLRNKLLSDAELYLFEMIMYIRHNLSSFPLFFYVQEVSGKTQPFLY